MILEGVGWYRCCQRRSGGRPSGISETQFTPSTASTVIVAAGSGPGALLVVARRVNEALPYPLLANAVLSLHVAIVVFVVGGLVAIIVGNLRAWRWVNALWFRAAHLAAILVVVAEAWLGAICPLTTFEMWLRGKAGATTYSSSFIEHWLQRILYYDAPTWVFTLGYTLFGVAVLAAWWYFPPKFRRRTHESAG